MHLDAYDRVKEMCDKETQRVYEILSNEHDKEIK